MKKVGIVGGLGPASTIDYYRDIVAYSRKEYGDVYPEIVIDSVDMNKLFTAMKNENKDELCELLINSINNLKSAGADFAIIASNTPHVVWNEIKDKVDIPMISIIECACNYIERNNYKTVIVFGTKYTMSNGLYDNTLTKRSINAIVPNEEDRDELDSIITPNLENGIVIEEDKKRMIQIAEKYIKKYNADALLLGCTEIPLMIKSGDVSVPIINSTDVHIREIVKNLK